MSDPAKSPVWLCIAVVIALPLMPASVALGGHLAPERVDPSIVDGSAQRKLDDARGRWRAAGFRSYRYLVRRRCFCPSRPVYRRVVVVRGRPSRRTPRDVRDVATVPRLFDKIQRSIRVRPARLVVSYGRYGVPRAIFVDRDLHLSDEEVRYSVRRFRPGVR